MVGGSAAPKTADGAGMAGRVLPLIGTFRYNARHLNITFRDGGHWEAWFGGSK